MSKENDGEIKSWSLSELTREVRLLRDAFNSCSDSIERSRREIGSYRRAQDVLLERTEAHTESINHLKESLGDAQKQTGENDNAGSKRVRLQQRVKYLEQCLADAHEYRRVQDKLREELAAENERLQRGLDGAQERIGFWERCLVNTQKQQQRDRERVYGKKRHIDSTPYKLISDRWFDGKAFTVDELLERCETTISYDTDGVFNLTVTGY